MGKFGAVSLVSCPDVGSDGFPERGIFQRLKFRKALTLRKLSAGRNPLNRVHLFTLFTTKGSTLVQKVHIVS